MMLEKLPVYRVDEHEWILSVEESGSREVRQLLRHGEEIRRWETAPAEGGERREERVLDHGVLSSRLLYGKAGELLVEESFTDGRLSSRSVSRFSGTRRTGVRTVSADGTLLYQDEYLLTPRGSLRRVRRTAADGSGSFAAVIAGSGGVSEEMDRTGNASFIVRYDERARAVEKERRVGDALALREDLTIARIPCGHPPRWRPTRRQAPSRAGSMMRAAGSSWKA